MGKRMYTVKEKKNSNTFTVKVENNRNAVAESLRNYHSAQFHDKREERGGSANVSRDYLDEYYEFDCD